MSKIIPKISKERVRDLWIDSQRLNQREPFGRGPEATSRAVEHLGYVQIDTIHVIERCHHHILFNRIPNYHRDHLHFAQTEQKSVFEYWTHALAYIPTKDFRFFMRAMADHRKEPSRWFGSAKIKEINRVLGLVKRDGALTIRDFDGEALVEKTHEWASRKPSKKALELAFYGGRLVISERVGMLKRYELTDRHFGWTKSSKPKPASANEEADYRLDRALRTQAVVSPDSVAYLSPSEKTFFAKRMESRVKTGALIEVQIEGLEKSRFWMKPEDFKKPVQKSTLTHLLSPFDPLVIQRKRLENIFGYEHKFEAYLPKEKRRFGYFALPVLMDDRFVALVDLKTDRAQKKLLIQNWTWRSKEKSKLAKKRIEDELHRFENFQLQIFSESDKIALT